MNINKGVECRKEKKNILKNWIEIDYIDVSDRNVYELYERKIIILITRGRESVEKAKDKR